MALNFFIWHYMQKNKIKNKKSLLEFPMAFVIFIDERWITNEIVLTHYDTNGKCAFDYITM